MQLKHDGGNSLNSNFVDAIAQALSRVSSTGNQKITVVLLPAVGNDSPDFTPIFKRGAEEVAKSFPFISRSAPEDLRTTTRNRSLHSSLAPVCYSSNSSCAESTNNCSGHGSCYLKYGSGDETAPNNCYACKCRPTVLQNSDGTVQKVQWGGPTCQKKDISPPFFLIAGVSFLVILIVSSAIGMLFNIGQSKLPSVIGAGLDGSKTRA